MQSLSNLKRTLQRYAKWCAPSSVAVLLIKAYRLAVSPLLGQNCRFYPSCSAYALEAFTKKGFIKGMFYTTWRLLRCHPFSAGGYDPLPGTPNILLDSERLRDENS